MNDMKENKNAVADTPVKVKRRSLYYILVTACALVLAAAVVLIVVFATNSPAPTLDDPGASEQPGGDEPGGEVPDEGDPDGEAPDEDEPDEPGSTEVVFSMPVSEGTLGTDAIARIINHPKLRTLPFCLETPQDDDDGYGREIALLRSLRTPV